MGAKIKVRRAIFQLHWLDRYYYFDHFVIIIPEMPNC